MPSWIRIRNLNADPDPATQINADPCGSGSETLIGKIEYNFQKSHVTGPWGHKDSVSTKKLFHSCCAAGFALLNLPKGKSLGRSKPETNS